MVSTTEPALTFVLYSEDRADADRDFEVLREVLLGMLQQICPELKTNHIRVEPAAALVEVDKSYAAVVSRLRASPIVARGLADASARPY